MEALRGESADSSSAVAALTARWAQLMDIEVPRDLQQALQAQQAACEGVLGCKGAVIEAARNILKAQDDEYVATLSAQAEVGAPDAPDVPASATCMPAYSWPRACDAQDEDALLACMASQAAALDKQCAAEAQHRMSACKQACHWRLPLTLCPSWS